MAGYQEYFNPGTGEWIEYLVTGAESDGALVRYRWRSVPGGSIPEHFHPRQEERFEIESGEAHFSRDGIEILAGPGDTVVIPAGARHSERNRGTEEVRGVVELRPALGAKELHEMFAGLNNDGKALASGAPKNPLQLGTTFWHYRDDIRVSSPPRWLQNLFLPPLWALGRAVGIKPYYERWNSKEE
ncbi:MAG: cupin domain-containing protein [Solirubrobacterales bacterium]